MLLSEFKRGRDKRKRKKRREKPEWMKSKSEKQVDKRNRNLKIGAGVGAGLLGAGALALALKKKGGVGVRKPFTGVYSKGGALAKRGNIFDGFASKIRKKKGTGTLTGLPERSKLTGRDRDLLKGSTKRKEISGTDERALLNPGKIKTMPSDPPMGYSNADKVRKIRGRVDEQVYAGEARERAAFKRLNAAKDSIEGTVRYNADKANRGFWSLRSKIDNGVLKAGNKINELKSKITRRKKKS